ncbi:MAG: glycosyltransferase family 4 protein [Pseudomonadota bacterium]
MSPRLAVVLKGYPRLSETFIAQELLALENAGHEFQIWSLRHPYDDREHPIHAQIDADRHYLPEYLHREPLRVLRSILHAATLPGFGRVLGQWLRDLARDRTANRVRRFGQACVLARELPVQIRFVYAHFLHTPASVTRYAARMRGIDWGFSAHAKDIWTTPDWEKREKIEDARFGVTCTETGARHLGGLDSSGKKISLVYHGLDLRRFPTPPDIRPRGNRFTILSVGRLVAKKGYDDLLAALAALPSEIDWTFVHIGGGKLAEPLAATAQDLGIADRIEWQGKRDQAEVVAAMRSADLFVLPSKIAADGDRDGLPNVLMEAASQKLPILSTAVSAIPEFVEDRVHGVLVPPGDRRALTCAMASLARDPERRARLAEAAYRRLTQHFGMSDGIAVIDGHLRAALATA